MGIAPSVILPLKLSSVFYFHITMPWISPKISYLPHVEYFFRREVVRIVSTTQVPKEEDVKHVIMQLKNHAMEKCPGMLRGVETALGVLSSLTFIIN